MCLVVVISVACTGPSSNDAAGGGASANQVPDVVGLGLAEACGSLFEAGFEPKIAGATGDQGCAARAVVTSQSLEPRASEEGAIVTLRVSPTKKMP